MAEYRNGYKAGQDGLTEPERRKQQRAAKPKASLKKRLALTTAWLGAKSGLEPHPDDTVFVREYTDPRVFKRHAKQLAKKLGADLVVSD